MAAYEILLLNTTIPQIQAAQSGDTYVVPRDIAFSAALTLSAGTANGVPYLNGSKVVTTGSALTFDGTTFTSTGAQGFLNTSGGNTARMIAVASGVFFGSTTAADVVFQYNQNEGMRLTSTGLGIGTSSPDRKLDVESGNAEAIRLSSGSYLSTNQGPWIGFDGGPSAGWNMARIQATRAGTEFQGNLLFFTNNSASDATAATERMRIDSSGNVGIGTTTTTNKLNVQGNMSVNDGSWYGFGDAEERIRGDNAGFMQFFTNGTEKVRMTLAGNLKLGGTVDRATTVGTNHLDIFNGTAPVGTLTDGISIYSSSGEAYVMDAAGNATLFSPHDAETNEWIFKSKHTPTGKVLKIDVERLLKFVNDHFGLDAVHEFVEE